MLPAEAELSVACSEKIVVTPLVLQGRSLTDHLSYLGAEGTKAKITGHGDRNRFYLLKGLSLSLSHEWSNVQNHTPYSFKISTPYQLKMEEGG